jgi:hypothetical protein
VRSQDSLATLSCHPDGLAHIVLITLIITLIKARVSVLSDLLHSYSIPRTSWAANVKGTAAHGR